MEQIKSLVIISKSKQNTAILRGVSFFGYIYKPNPAHMKRFIGFLLLITLSVLSSGQPIVTTPPDKIYGKLFVDVQMERVFADGKTFVDCLPKRKPAEIVADYEAQKGTAGF